MLCNGKVLWDIWFHTTVDLDDRKKICRLWRQRVQLGSRDALSRGKSSGGSRTPIRQIPYIVKGVLAEALMPIKEQNVFIAILWFRK